MQDQSPLAHDLPLLRSPLTSMYTRSTDRPCSTHFTDLFNQFLDSSKRLKAKLLLALKRIRWYNLPQSSQNKTYRVLMIAGIYIVKFRTAGRHSRQACDFSPIKLQCTQVCISLEPKGSRFTIPRPPTPPKKKKRYVKKKISLGLELSDSNSATFQGIIAILDADRSTKPVVVVLVMSLHIYWKCCCTSSKCQARNNRYNLIYLSRAPK